MRPWKSRLSLVCIENASIKSNIIILYLTAIAVFNRKSALIKINRILAKWNTDEKLQKVALRNTSLTPHPPMGSNDIVEHRKQANHSHGC
ncbi:hypothetical protein VDG1235_1562 [Verrucomicrobiia bacterium DG1235]|nr:hypothetical protein VDG1235_1562 [Verrucomicrobiae bacterium DG1235]